MAMDLPPHHFFQPSPSLLPLPSPSPAGGIHESPIESSNAINLYDKSKGSNPFAVADAFPDLDPDPDPDPDPLCSINLRETSDFVKSLPISDSRGFSAHRRREGNNCVVTHTQRRVEAQAPSTPGRPVFSFTSARRSFPSKWDDAEKWVMSTPSSQSQSQSPSPAHHSQTVSVKLSVPSNMSGSHSHDFKQQMQDFADKSRVTQERVSNSKPVPNFQGSVASLDHHNNGILCSTHVVLKDKFTESREAIFPNFRYLEPTKEGFLFRNPAGEAVKDACTEVEHKDVGTEMTPLGSSTTSRCHTPFKSSSPARHNTPASRSGPLSLANHDNTSCTIDLIRLEECHFAKLQLGTQYESVTTHWSSREEEEEEISKSLRHNASQKADSDCRAATWEEEAKTKCCLRYQREEAKIQAWVDLQSAKAEAQLRKLEVKIQKMRSNLEEKLMKRMAVVHRKAEDWRAAAKQQHLEQIQKASEHAQKIMNQHNSLVSGHNSCGCFPCNNNHL